MYSLELGVTSHGLIGHWAVSSWLRMEFGPLLARGPAASHLASQSLPDDVSDGWSVPGFSPLRPAVSSHLWMVAGPSPVEDPVSSCYEVLCNHMNLVGPCVASSSSYCCGTKPFLTIGKLRHILPFELGQLRRR